VHESIREMLARIRRDALRQRRITEPSPPTCEVCGHSVAYVPTIWPEKGEEDCPACRQQRREYPRRHTERDKDSLRPDARGGRAVAAGRGRRVADRLASKP
jgi:predicted Zn-ribbon and HTH transcriptional regulator